jgi:Flp pilus assembly protein TadD
MAACPGSLDSREQQVRSWHLGPTSDLARCLGRTLGREGRQAPQRVQELLGMRPDAAVGFLRWAHGQAVAAAPTPPPPSRDQLMAQGNEHYRAGRYSDAVRVFEQVVAAEPGFGPAHQALATARLQTGDARGAADAFRTAARLAPRSAAIQVGLARALTQLGDREGAVAAYRMALTLEPRNAEATRELAALSGPNEGQLRQQARAHFQAQRFAEAEAAYRQLTGMVPNDAGVHAGLGASLLALGRAADAVAAYRRATELDGRNAGFFAALGAALERAGDVAGARAAYERAVAIEPRQRTAREALGRLGPTPAAPTTGSRTAVIASALPQPTEPPPPAAPAEPALPETPSRDDIVRTMQPFEERLEACAPTVDAMVTFRLRIGGADGRLQGVQVLGFLAGTDEGSCMERHLASARFPRFTRELLEVAYPFQLRGPQANQPETEAPPPVR